MPVVDCIFFSYYESDFVQQHRALKKELNEYKDFIQETDYNWTDERKNEFFQKNINDTVKEADSYLFLCEKLIGFIEEARGITED